MSPIDGMSIGPRLKDREEEKSHMVTFHSSWFKEINLMMSDETRRQYFSDETTDSELGAKAMESAGVGGAIGVTA
jgi:hypothetical protein